MSKRKAPTPEEAAVFIGSFFSEHKRPPAAREMREAFGGQGSLETYAALLRAHSDLSEARPQGAKIRTPDWWDEFGDLARKWHEADAGTQTFKLQVQLKTVERERDEARDQLARLQAGCKHACRPVTFEWDDDDISARAYDGSITLGADEMEAICREATAARAAANDDPSAGAAEFRPPDDDDIPF